MIPFFKNCNMSTIHNLLNITFYIVLLTIITFMWFKIQNLESYIFMISDKLNKKTLNHHNKSIPSEKSQDNIEEFNMADILMNEVFNNTSCCSPSPNINTDLPIIHHFKNCKEEDDIKIQVEEKKQEVDVKEEPDDIIEIFDLKKEDDDKKSIISDTNTLSKTKLSKMSLDKIKEKCVELKISSDGSKNQLIEKILSQQSS